MPGDFYFLKDKFYSDFPDCGLMPNKNTGDTATNSRPCFFSFQDKKNSNIYWFVPISSRVEKYETIEAKIIDKYGKCDTIVLGEVLGQRRAFLIQNMFPATRDYIAERYVHNEIVVQTDKITTNTIIKKSEDVLEKSKYGIKLTFTDIDKIYSTLLNQIEEKAKRRQKLTSCNKVKLIGELINTPTAQQISGAEGDMDITQYEISVNSNDRNDVFNIASYGKQAQMDLKYLKKGNTVMIEGNIQTGQRIQDGVQIPTFRINAEKVSYFRPVANTNQGAGNGRKPIQSGNGDEQF